MAYFGSFRGLDYDVRVPTDFPDCLRMCVVSLKDRPLMSADSDESASADAKV